METIATCSSRRPGVAETRRPDALLILGDTNSCLMALAAKRRKIPVFHMEAGNRCFDQRVPEEINRKIVDHLSDVNLTYTEHARRYLLSEGVAPDTVIKTGSPMKEVIGYYREAIDGSKVLDQLGLQARGYMVVSAHREENVDVPERLAALIDSVNALVVTHDMPIVFSVHPRTRKRLEKAPELVFDQRVRAIAPLGFLDYIKLQQEAFCVVSDSGTITEESGLLGFPAVTIRQAHERPEGMDEGTLVMCEITPSRVLEAVRLVTQQVFRDRTKFRTPADYEPDNVSTKVVRIIVSYVDYIRRTVWFDQEVRS